VPDSGSGMGAARLGRLRPGAASAALPRPATCASRPLQEVRTAVRPVRDEARPRFSLPVRTGSLMSTPPCPAGDLSADDQDVGVLGAHDPPACRRAARRRTG
jgi:hypothetical protein